MTASATETAAYARRAVAWLGLSLAAVALVACGDRSNPPPKAAEVEDKNTKAEPLAMRSHTDVPFEHSWDLKLPKPVHTSWISENIPELIFFQVEDSGEIYAVDTMSGHTKWVTRPLPKPISLTPFVARVVMPGPSVNQKINDDRLYVISDDILFCFDAVYGQLIWRHQVPFSPSSGPMAVGSEGNLRIYTGDWGGRLQVSGFNLAKQFPLVLWQWNLNSPVVAPAVERDGLVYVGDDSGKMNCFHFDRELAWSFKAGGGIFGSALVRPPNVYFGTKDNVFYALNRLSGEMRGSLYLNAPVRRKPFAYLVPGAGEPEHLFVWTSDPDPKLGGLHAIKTSADLIAYDENNKKPPRELERLKLDWYVPGVTRLVSSTPDHLYVMKPHSTTVRAINRVTGHADWAWDLDDGRKKGHEVAHVTEYQDPTDLNRSIYTVDPNGQIDAFRLFGYKPKDNVAMAKQNPAAAQPKAEKPAAKPKAEAKPAEEKAAEEKPAEEAKPAE